MLGFNELAVSRVLVHPASRPRPKSAWSHLVSFYKPSARPLVRREEGLVNIEHRGTLEVTYRKLTQITLQHWCCRLDMLKSIIDTILVSVRVLTCHAVDGPPSKSVPPQNRSPRTVSSRIYGPPGPNIAAIPGPPPATDGPTLVMAFRASVEAEK